MIRDGFALTTVALLLALASLPPSAAAADSQTIKFDPIPNQIFGISPFVIAAQATSYLPIGFISTTPGVCTTTNVLVTLKSAGTCSITASQPGNASYNAAKSVTRSFTVTLAKTSGSFQAAAGSPFAAESYPHSVAVGDFNGDGIQDIAIANSESSDVTVLLGNGSGGFAAVPRSPFAVGADTSPLSVVTGDFNGDGIQDLATANGGSNNVSVLLGNGSGGFSAAPGSPFAVGSNPNAVVVGDFNGDGIQDLATANGVSSDVTVLFGNGTGGFSPAPGKPFSLVTGPFTLVVGDFNGDGIQDLATAHELDKVTVLLGNGSGGFTAAPGSPLTVGTTPSSLIVGDFNGDGIEDLATANYDSNDITVLLGKGSGSFTPATGSPFKAETNPGSLVAGDFNGDGIQDLVSANSGSNDVTVLLGNGTGGFTPAVGNTFEVGTTPVSTAVGDFNGDGISDLAIANYGSNDVTVLLGIVVGGASQTITFGPLSNVTYGLAPFAISATASSGLSVSFSSTTSTICTVSGNLIDVITAGTCTIIASQAGNAAYAAAATVMESFTVNRAPQTIAFEALSNVPLSASAFNVSATATSGNAVSFASNTPAVCTLYGNNTVRLVALGFCSITATQPELIGGGFNAAPPVTRSFDVIAGVSVPDKPSGTLLAASGSPFTVGKGPSFAAVGDFNRDGFLDLAVTNYATDNLTVLLGNGKGGFTAPAGNPFPAGTSPGSVAVGDFNEDGIPDVAISNFNEDTITVLLGNGKGGFAPAAASPVAAGTGPESVVVADFNGDGHQDLAVANQGPEFGTPGSVTVLLGNGTGGFAAAMGSPFTVGADPASVAVGDFNGDGAQDLAIANNGGDTVTVLLGNSSGGFTAAASSPFVVGYAPISVAVGDFNKDGSQDLAVSILGGNITVLLGNGSGGFKAAASSPFATGTFPYSVVVGDFNGDGIQDLATANDGDDTVTVLLGNGSGGFTAAAGSPVAAGTSPRFAVVGDFNGDGRLDLATPDVGGNSVTVLLGASAATGSLLSTTAPLTVAGGATVPLTLTVSDTVTAFDAPTGTVTFLDGTTSLGESKQMVSPYTFSASSLGAGSHTLTATYSGDARSLGSTSNSLTIQVNGMPQSISFGPLSAQVLGAVPFNLSGSASSGLSVTFASNTTSICTVSGATVTLVAVGTCSITASQAGNSNYAAASPVTRTFIVSAGPPAIVSLSPNSGSGTTATFKAVYSDTSGAADLDEILLQVNTTQNSANACYIYYQPQGNHLYLANNAGSAWITPSLTPGAAGTASNSQCTLNAGSSSVTTLGNDLTLSVALSFSGTVVGGKNVYLYAKGLSGQNSGWVKEGTWTPVSAGPPAIVSISPSAGAGSFATFKAVYSDPDGAADLNEILLQINTTQSGANACYIYYQPQGNHLYLANNAGAWITPALTPGVAGTVSNSQCELNAGSSSVTTSGNDLTLNVALTFSSVKGSPNVYLYAAGFSGQNSGWVKEGTWTPNPFAGPPAIVSLSPNSGSADSVTFKAVYSDPNGAADLNEILLQINTGQSGVNACYVYYQPQGNHLYLANNAGAWITPALTPGVAGTASNSRCTLNAASSSVTISGNDLTLNAALTFSGTVLGYQNVYLYAAGFSGQNSGWVREGSLTPNFSAWHTGVVSLSPSSGTGNSVTFQAVYSDPAGAGDLNDVELWVNSTASSGNGCNVYYQPQGNHLHLITDAGSDWGLPLLTPGVAGTVSNSQCTLNAGSSSVTMSGNDLTLTVTLTFSDAFIGSKNVYLFAGGLTEKTGSGFTIEGTWTP